MTQTSIKCHPKKKAPTVIDPEERWIQVFPIHFQREIFQQMVDLFNFSAWIHQLLARQKSPPMTIHFQSKIQADQSWILLFERFCENLLKTLWKRMNFFYNTVTEYNRCVMLQPQPEFFASLFWNDEFPMMVLKSSMQEVMLGYLSSGCDTSSASARTSMYLKQIDKRP